MRILSVREASPVTVDGKSIRMTKVTFDETISYYKYDRKSQVNVLVEDDSVTLTSFRWCGIIYAAHAKCAEIGSALINNGKSAWFNMAQADASIDFKVENDEKELTSFFSGENLVFSKEGLQQNILHLGQYLHLGLTEKAEKTEKLIEKSLESQIDDII